MTIHKPYEAPTLRDATPEDIERLWMTERKLEEMPFDIDYNATGVYVHTQFGGWPTLVTRLEFTDAEAWQVRQIYVGQKAQLDPRGLCADLFQNVQGVFDVVEPGIVFRVTVERSPGSALTSGKITFYGRQRQQ